MPKQPDNIPQWQSMNIEPKRKFRWAISFSTIGNDAAYMVKSVKKPSLTSTIAEHSYLNHIFKYPGKVKWENIDVTFIDSFQANIGSRFYNILRASGYKQPLGPADTLVGFTKANMVAALGEVKIRQLDGGSVLTGEPALDVDPTFFGANVREEWVLKNTQLVSIKFGDGLSYEDEKLVEVSVQLAYDYATMTEMNVPYPG